MGDLFYYLTVKVAHKIMSTLSCLMSSAGLTPVVRPLAWRQLLFLVSQKPEGSPGTGALLPPFPAIVLAVASRGSGFAWKLAQAAATSRDNS